MKIKPRFHAGNLVSQGASDTYGVGRMRRRGRVPDGLPDRSPTRHETPLARPSQATKISKPNSFAYPFQSRPRGVPRPPRLDLAAAKTSSYRDTANLGFGVTPRPGRDSDYFGSGVAHCRRKPYEWCRVLLATRRASNVATMWSTSSVSKSIRIGAATRMAAPLPLAVRSTSTT